MGKRAVRACRSGGWGFMVAEDGTKKSKRRSFWWWFGSVIGDVFRGINRSLGGVISESLTCPWFLVRNRQRWGKETESIRIYLLYISTPCAILRLKHPHQDISGRTAIQARVGRRGIRKRQHISLPVGPKAVYAYLFNLWICSNTFDDYCPCGRPDISL